MIDVGKRIIISGAVEAANSIDPHNIAGIVTLSRRPMIYELDKGYHFLIERFLERIESLHIPHFYSQLFHKHDTEFDSIPAPEEIRQNANEIYRFTQECLANAEPWQKILYHCTHGRDRSAFAFTYTIYRQTGSLPAALTELRDLRPAARMQNFPDAYFPACFGEDWRLPVNQFWDTIPRSLESNFKIDKPLSIGAYSKTLTETARHNALSPGLKLLRRGMDLLRLKR